MAEAVAGPVRVETLDGIPEPLHAHFAKVETEEGERFEYRPPTKDTASLESTLAKKKRREQELESELKAIRERYSFDGQELDPDQIRQLIEERRQREGKEMLSRADAEKEFEERKAKALTGKQKEVEQKEAELQELQATLHEVIVVGGILAETQRADAPFRLQPGAAEWLIDRATAKGEVKVDGRKAVPMDGDKPATNAKGDTMSLMDWIAAQVEKYPWLAMPSQGTGSAPAINGAPPRKKRSEMSWSEKSEFIDKYGEEKFTQLPL